MSSYRWNQFVHMLNLIIDLNEILVTRMILRYELDWYKTINQHCNGLRVDIIICCILIC